MDQEFAEVVRQLFDRQRYPDLRDGPEGAPEPPYDAAGWTLPYLTDVKVLEVRTPLSAAAAASLVPVAGRPSALEATDAPFTTNAVAAGIVAPPSRITGAGPAMSVDPAQNDAFRFVNRALRAGGAVRMRAGRYVVSGVAGGTLEGWARDLGLRAERTSDVAGVPVGTRLALYQPSAPSMDAGWTEWLLDRHEFRYAQIGNGDLQAGDLRQRFDVILVASDRAATLRDGYVAGRVPPSLEGGIGDEGIRALDAFVRAGGTLVAMNASAAFAIEALHLPVRNVVRGLPPAQFFASGSILEVATDTAHAVMAGMPERAKVFFDQSPAFSAAEGFVGTTLARYAPAGSPLLSGYLLGESHLPGTAAALDVAHGRGHVILLGFRPQWRGQTIGTFRVLLNAALYAPAVRTPSSE